ncbi:MAG: DUF2518 family protein [Cyanothece sp. SIO1E1]|nr:DUF2518 family protein [Cyanothece sp. SIO1E1]
MPTPAEFLQATQWAGILTLVFAALTGLAFLLNLGFRFRLVGATGFMLVLTSGFFGLSVVPFTRTMIPGAVPFSTVYDSGTAQVVIKVSDAITPSQLEATLRQAASDLLSPGRLGLAGQGPIIRARTMLHPESGTSQILYLGQVTRATDPTTEDPLKIDIFSENLAKLPQAE